MNKLTTKQRLDRMAHSVAEALKFAGEKHKALEGRMEKAERRIRTVILWDNEIDYLRMIAAHYSLPWWRRVFTRFPRANWKSVTLK